MNVKVDGRNLKIDIWDLLSHLPEEGKLDLADTLGCMDQVIKNVAAQIIDGYTEAGSHGATGDPLSSWPSQLDAARKYVAENSSETAKQEIWRLTWLLQMSRDAEEKHYATKRQNEDLTWRVKVLSELLEAVSNHVIDEDLIERIDNALGR